MHSPSILAGETGIFKVFPLMVQFEVVIAGLLVLPLMATADSTHVALHHAAINYIITKHSA